MGSANCALRKRSAAAHNCSMRLRAKVHLRIVAVALGMQAGVATAQPLQQPRIALVIPGPANCVLDGLTRPALQESHLDPSTVTLYCYSNRREDVGRGGRRPSGRATRGKLPQEP